MIGSGVWSLGFRVWGLGFRVYDMRHLLGGGARLLREKRREEEANRDSGRWWRKGRTHPNPKGSESDEAVVGVCVCVLSTTCVASPDWLSSANEIFVWRPSRLSQNVGRQKSMYTGPIPKVVVH